MTLKECTQILGVPANASLDEVKRAYRRRAFELHPDLNPQMSDAGRQFQRLNEAYVILTRLATARESADPRSRSGEAEAARKAAEQKAAEQKAAEQKAAEQKAAEQKAAEQKAAEQKAAEQKAAERKAAEQKAAEHKAEHSGQGAEATGADATGQKADAAQGETDGQRVYAEQQEVLRDILNDPFARRVFEDIYSEVRKKGGAMARPVQATSAAGGAAASRSPKTVPGAAEQESGFLSNLFSFNWGQRKGDVDVSKGMGGAVKNWLRSQIDEEQTFVLPAARLFPGAKVRLQIRQGLSESVTTLDVTLPQDFVSGKPIRLRGMGKKLGRWQGDLYLRLYPKN